MNTPNINSVNAGDPLGRNRGVASGRDAKRTDTADFSGDVTNAVPETSPGETAAPNPAADTYQTSTDRGFVEDLVAAVENEEPPVREDKVAVARQRVSEGYYNTEEAMTNLAISLLNTTRRA